MSTPEQIAPWERQAHEPETAYAFFLAFRDQAYPEGFGFGAPYVPRSQKALAEAFGCAPYHCGALAHRHQWAVRLLAFDRWVDRQRLGGAVTEAQEARAEHRRMLMNVKRLAEAEIAKHLDRAEADPTVTLTSVTEAVVLIEKVIKLDRLILGETTDNVGGTSAGTLGHARAKAWNLEALRLEELEALEALREKARGAEPESVH